jgi:hypothetical protein
MKNTILFVLALLFVSATIQAQSTADSIAAKYKLLPMPEQLTIEKKFPVLGTYQLSTEADPTAATPITITLDPDNKGIIWIDGLKEGKIKAYLKRSPSTYRIVAQKSGSGKSVPEGTLTYDLETSTLHVAIGKAFNEADPTAVFTSNSEVTAKSKSKSKVKLYTATRVVTESVQAVDASAQPQ